MGLIGCGESEYRPQINTRPSFSITINELASRLGLTVKTSGSPYYELTNANNRVLLFTYENGQAYVNGKSIGQTNAVNSTNGTSYVPQMLVPKIRSHLITAYTPPVITPPAGGGFYSGTVVIDPGHGGKDPGGQSVLGYWEKGVNLEIARRVKSYLEKSGVDVVMTRNSDVYPTLEERAALANRINADLFASIHCDSNGDSAHRGFTIYIARQASWTSKKMGRTLENTLSNAGIPSKGVRNQNYRVLVKTKCPAVLIECGYMTNYDEAGLLTDGWYQDKLARAIAEGIKQSL